MLCRGPEYFIYQEKKVFEQRKHVLKKFLKNMAWSIDYLNKKKIKYLKNIENTLLQRVFGLLSWFFLCNIKLVHGMFIS